MCVFSVLSQKQNGHILDAGINVVYKRLPVLGIEECARNVERERSPASTAHVHHRTYLLRCVWAAFGGARRLVTQNTNDWHEFLRLPVFPSSLAISLLYLTVLS